MVSQSDIRFLASTDKPASGVPTTKLNAPLGDLHFIAQQLYPTTGAVVNVSAGIASNGTLLAGSVLSIESIDGSIPALPFSVFGSLSLAAPTVLQGGIVRAPLGSITIGQVGSAAVDTQTELLRGEYYLGQRRRLNHALWRHSGWRHLHRRRWCAGRAQSVQWQLRHQ